MSWLNYNDDEVLKFHKEFEIIANEALADLNLQLHYEWKHHLRLPGSSGIIPDFVLRKSGSNEWIVAYEIKRTIRDVYSSRYQYQAKSYAEDNRQRYRTSFPLYFVLSNLEVTLLFANKETERPELCRIENGFFASGTFNVTNTTSHKWNFKEDLKKLIDLVINKSNPVFENIWPSVVDDLKQHIQSFPDNEIPLDKPSSPNWMLVSQFLSYDETNNANTIFLLRCLMAEYLRGRLHFYGHPKKMTIPPLSLSANSAANTIAALSAIDFKLLYEGTASKYLSLPPHLVNLLQDYIKKIIPPYKDVANLAVSRGDAPILLESFINLLYPGYIHDGRGKIPTDPELASLLTCVAINDVSANILDPCCGDGALLLAGYERLKTLGASHESALKQTYGIEADGLSVRLCALRLAMTSPATINNNSGENILNADMFSSEQVFVGKKIILLNPPFRRYEEQEEIPFPPELREHYRNSIVRIKGTKPVTLTGQPNLFNYFVEFVSHAIEEGTKFAIILDNKWYHSKYGLQLKQLLIGSFQLHLLIEYPHNVFFKNHDIATSIIVATKRNCDTLSKVKFIRSTGDPRSVDLQILSDAIHQTGPWPLGWSCQLINQSELEAQSSWKSFFTLKLVNEYRFNEWPAVTELFANIRRGSLQKEEGGLKVFAFPFSLTDFGPTRSKFENGRSFQTKIGRDLSSLENQSLTQSASSIAENFRGYALQNSDDIDNYVLNVDDVTKKQCIEPPALRSSNSMQAFFGVTRSSWTPDHDQALAQLKRNAHTKAYLKLVSEVVGLNTKVLPKENLWVDLREPYAGELIIPRKTRAGHKVHVNPFAINTTTRQIRISSNFLSFSGCNAVNLSSGLDRLTSTQLIAAFLLSSFGQLQFEQLGNNREGLLSMEEHNFKNLKVFDPRWVRDDKRKAIIDIFFSLPFPISTGLLSNLQVERNKLDRLFGEEIINWQVKCQPAQEPYRIESLLQEVHDALDEWLISRQP